MNFFPPGFNPLTVDIHQVIQNFINSTRRQPPHQLQQRQQPPQWQFWTEPFQSSSNSHFKTLQFRPISNAPIHDLDRAMSSLPQDITPTIKKLCRDLQGVKVWPVLFVRYESANPLDEPFKIFDSHLPVSHSIFFQNQPEVGLQLRNP